MQLDRTLATASTTATASATLPAVLGATPAFPVHRRGIRTVPLRGGRWRVTREAGEVLGYIERVDDVAGSPRWRSSRMLPRRADLQTIGDFDTAADALDVVRLG